MEHTDFGSVNTSYTAVCLLVEEQKHTTYSPLFCLVFCTNFFISLKWHVLNSDCNWYNCLFFFLPLLSDLCVCVVYPLQGVALPAVA